MVTISHLVKKSVKDNSFLVEALGNDLISHGNLAEKLKPEIEKELGKKVKESAIVMALRRYSEELKTINKKTTKLNLEGEIILRTNVMDFNVVKSPALLAKIKNLYNLVDFSKGDVLNIILGNNEIAIVANEKYKDKITEFLKGEKIVTREFNLVAVTISFSTKDFLNTPGIIFTAVRKLAWENINIYEIISTMTELTFIIKNKNSMKAYNVLHELFGK
ncbi:hypothetical protein ISS07_05570 [Candidatus Woesearchaeota archaeon]|nr:hypothetical protein [Candidatus Woesearchaeota archaeon]